MSGERPFDDDRWPDEEGSAHCFMCGKKVDPLDKHRVTYTMNASACEPLPAHGDCVFGADIMRVQVAFMAALTEMGDANAKKAREAARCAIVSPIGN